MLEQRGAALARARPASHRGDRGRPHDQPHRRARRSCPRSCDDTGARRPSAAIGTSRTASTRACRCRRTSICRRSRREVRPARLLRGSRSRSASSSGHSGPKVLLIGDSHAQSFMPAFVGVARKYGLHARDRDRHRTARGSGASSKRRSAQPDHPAAVPEHQDDWYERVVPQLDPDIVVLVAPHARRPAHAERVGLPDGSRVQLRHADFEKRRSTRRVDSTIDRLRRQGRKIVIIEPLPVAPARSTRSRACRRRSTSTTAATSPARSRRRSSGTSARSPTARDVYTIDLDRLVCPYLPICDPIVGGIVVKKDRAAHHRRVLGGDGRRRSSRLLVDDGMISAVPADGCDAQRSGVHARGEVNARIARAPTTQHGHRRRPRPRPRRVEVRDADPDRGEHGLRGDARDDRALRRPAAVDELVVHVAAIALQQRRARPAAGARSRPRCRRPARRRTGTRALDDRAPRAAPRRGTASRARCRSGSCPRRRGRPAPAARSTRGSRRARPTSASASVALEPESTTNEPERADRGDRPAASPSSPSSRFTALTSTSTTDDAERHVARRRAAPTTHAARDADHELGADAAARAATRSRRRRARARTRAPSGTSSDGRAPATGADERDEHGEPAEVRHRPRVHLQRPGLVDEADARREPRRERRRDDRDDERDDQGHTSNCCATPRCTSSMAARRGSRRARRPARRRRCRPR